MSVRRAAWVLALLAGQRTASLRSVPTARRRRAVARPAPRRRPGAKSVAVLYFDTRDTTDRYLVDGLTEEWKGLSAVSDCGASVPRCPRTSLPIRASRAPR